MSDLHIAILGLGEAGSRFANDLVNLGVQVTGWDPNPQRELHPRIIFSKNNQDACRQADIIFSVNLSSVSELVAKEVLPALNSKKIYAEMNTSSPEMKVRISNILKSSGVQFVDVAIMAPVPPKGIFTPLLTSGPGALILKEKVSHLNLYLSVLNDTVGDASTRKLLRSIVYKGIAAVICEAVEAGKVFELEGYVREQIQSIIGGNSELIDRFIEGSVTHAERRTHEMEAVARMLESKGIEPILSKAVHDNLARLIERK
jgi:3-hydroxyisobutyrate dehydrogenase-like beta-hydroxyacid dehydrogenase